MKNTQSNYGWLTIILHWLAAVLILGLFSLGYWMVELGYYDPWYKQGPELHKSFGFILFALMVVRLWWKLKQTQPLPLNSHTKFERTASAITHKALYFLVFLIIFSGYLISTADGRAIEVFQLFNIASMGELFTNQEDTAGLIHQYGAYTLIALVIVHALAAIKHHVIDKDSTLIRMLGKHK